MHIQPARPIRFLILGGGTAGWMAANLLQHQLARKVEVTLVESQDIGIIGVGEGSTPQLKLFFEKLGISESEWMPKCNATYKNGISFYGWSSQAEFAQYFHPFPSYSDRDTAGYFLQNCMLKRHGRDVTANPDPFFLAAKLAELELSPKSKDGKNYGVSYGYHFDSHLLGKFLKQVAVKKGVTHRVATIESIRQNEKGEISELVCQTGERITADIFLDCSGFRSVLMQQTLQVPFQSYKDVLFNNSAVAIANDHQGRLMSETKAVAMQAGWRWQIPLTNRNGNGYVYSDNYISAEQAETELRASLNMLDTEANVRHLKMKVGRVQHHWHQNCLAVGLSQGFIEPLEATALHLVQETIESFISAFQAGNYSDMHQAEFNQRINARFDGIRDYIVCHYKANQRLENPYWQDCANISQHSEQLKAVLSCWFSGKDITQVLEKLGIAGYYPAVSWHCLLAGYGCFTNVSGSSSSSSSSSEQQLRHIKQLIAAKSSVFLPQQQAIDALALPLS